MLTHKPLHVMQALPERDQQQHAEQEELVRLTAQNILFRNLRVVAGRRKRWWRRYRRPGSRPGPGFDWTLVVHFSSNSP